MGFEGDMIVI